ncbi:MAG: phosphoglycerate kinase [Hyphomicrobiaceae bacterium]|nr:phosphoglycerate kinase [Hyphomicrobiaceae bacterium]
MDLNKLNTLDTLDVSGKRVLVRVDINVPLRDGKVTDDTRIRAIVPTVRDILAKGGRPILMAHLGRPKGKPVPEMSLALVCGALEAALGRPVEFADESAGKRASDWAADLQDGEVLLLENVRFHAGEEANSPEFTRVLAALGDVYVNDAFSAAHRAHASTEGLAHMLPSAAGRQMEAEIRALQTALEQPQRPVAAVVGGAKVSTKIPVLTNLVAKVDKLIIGGGMANTFLLADGIEVGKSLAEPDLVETARKIRDEAKAKGCEIIVPTDVVVAKEFKAGADSAVVGVDAVPADAMILDVGPKSVEALAGVVGVCKTVLWNGPMGAFEIEPFGEGTFRLAAEVAAMTRQGKLVSVAGGGDTVAALNAAGVTGDFTYVSTAGGAFLEWLEGRELPGVVALLKD